MTSDNVLSIAFCDIDEDDEYELIVGCEDSSINIFKGEELIYEIDESSPVELLASFGIKHFGFALKNRSFGVYENRR
jgi:Ciliary BBSome complex subunit 2, middle region